MTIIQQDNNNICYPKSIQDENINGVTICPHVISKLPKMSRFRLWLPSLSSSVQALYIINQLWHAREIYKDWIASISNTHSFNVRGQQRALNRKTNPKPDILDNLEKPRPKMSRTKSHPTHTHTYIAPLHQLKKQDRSLSNLREAM